VSTDKAQSNDAADVAAGVPVGITPVDLVEGLGRGDERGPLELTGTSTGGAACPCSARGTHPKRQRNDSAWSGCQSSQSASPVVRPPVQPARAQFRMVPRCDGRTTDVCGPNVSIIHRCHGVKAKAVTWYPLFVRLRSLVPWLQRTRSSPAARRGQGRRPTPRPGVEKGLTGIPAHCILTHRRKVLVVAVEAGSL
jgi:hypothetical protein